MNKRINQLINQLHLDPKKEAAVRKIVENAGGINGSTPAGDKDIYFLDIDNYKTPEDYNKLKAAFDSSKLIIGQGGVFTFGELPNGALMGIAHTILGGVNNTNQLQIIGMVCLFGTDGSIAKNNNQFLFDGNGSGTKFLSDDGTYKEVSGGSGPVIIEYPNVSNEEIAVTDEQIEAVKNGNVKIKLTMTGTTNYIISAPISIAIMEEIAEIVVRSYFGENITDAILLVDFTNKTISIPA